METIRINVSTFAVNLVPTKTGTRRELNDEKCDVSINNKNKLKINWVSTEMVHHGLGL